MSMRINKFISEAGFCSRREADHLITTRKVTINGRVAQLGSVVEEGDDVRVSGKRVTAQQKPKAVYIALNKPVGIVSTTDRREPANIVDYVGHEERIFPIGRLDKDSEGLILLTNDGDIVNKILRAEGRHEKEYLVTVNKPMTAQFLQGMARGVRILGTKTLPCQVFKEGDRVFRIILTQGLNRQIRRMCEAFGYEVKRLERLRIMNVELGALKPGQYRELSAGEIKELFKVLDYQPNRQVAQRPERPAQRPAPRTPAPRQKKAPGKNRRPANRPPQG